MTSLTVLLWHVAICLVDIVIVAISETLFHPIADGLLHLIRGFELLLDRRQRVVKRGQLLRPLPPR